MGAFGPRPYGHVFQGLLPLSVKTSRFFFPPLSRLGSFFGKIGLQVHNDPLWFEVTKVEDSPPLRGKESMFFFNDTSSGAVFLSFSRRTPPPLPPLLCSSTYSFYSGTHSLSAGIASHGPPVPIRSSCYANLVPQRLCAPSLPLPFPAAPSPPPSIYLDPSRIRGTCFPSKSVRSPIPAISATGRNTGGMKCSPS